MENISKIDPRLAIVDCTEPDAVWHAVSEPPFALHGVFFEAEVMYRTLAPLLGIAD